MSKAPSLYFLLNLCSCGSGISRRVGEKESHQQGFAHEVHKFTRRRKPTNLRNVLLLGVHMAFYSAHETLDCLATADTESKGTPCGKRFHFMKLVN